LLFQTIALSFLQMAETWEQLAEARRKQLHKEGRTEEGDVA
jgi:hypothetical protein